MTSRRQTSVLLLLSALGYSVVSLLVTRASLAHMPMMQIMTVRLGMQVIAFSRRCGSRSERGWLGVH